VKPDIVTYGKSIRGSSLKNGCRQLSGTSMASPVVTGSIALLLSSLRHRSDHHPSHNMGINGNGHKESRATIINPASIKQILIESAVPIEGASIFEQGSGRLNLRGAYNTLQSYKPHASVIPSSLDLTSCPYMWPWCSQELYYTAIPLLVNLTVLNGMSVSGRLAAVPLWTPHNTPSSILDVHFTYSELLWPWTGYVGVSIRVQRSVTTKFIASGVISFVVLGEEPHQQSSVNVTLRVAVIPTPSRSRRILWDQYHNMRYPSGYFPRDNLEEISDVLDWNGDHLHTNFRDIYDGLRAKGYYLEVIGHDLTCFDASLYGTLLIVDPEEVALPSLLPLDHSFIYNLSICLLWLIGVF
jgi:membrane-bound transcription factor site-1 protease